MDEETFDEFQELERKLDDFRNEDINDLENKIEDLQAQINGLEDTLKELTTRLNQVDSKTDPRLFSGE